MEFTLCGSRDDVDEFSRDDDDLSDLGSIEEFDDARVGQRCSLGRFFVGVGGDGDAGTYLPLDLNRDLHVVIDQERRVCGRELRIDDRIDVTHTAPQLLGHVGNQRRNHSNERIGHDRGRWPVEFGDADGKRP